MHGRYFLKDRESRSKVWCLSVAPAAASVQQACKHNTLDFQILPLARPIPLENGGIRAAWCLYSIWPWYTATMVPELNIIIIIAYIRVGRGILYPGTSVVPEHRPCSGGRAAGVRCCRCARCGPLSHHTSGSLPAPAYFLPVGVGVQGVLGQYI